MRHRDVEAEMRTREFEATQMTRRVELQLRIAKRGASAEQVEREEPENEESSSEPVVVAVNNNAPVRSEVQAVESAVVPQQQQQRPATGELVPLIVRTLTGRSYDITAKLSETVLHVKELLHVATGMPPDRQQLVFNGRQLEENRTLASYGVRETSTLHFFS
jgi:large subunit ribosomal protein L40e